MREVEQKYYAQVLAAIAAVTAATAAQEYKLIAV